MRSRTAAILSLMLFTGTCLWGQTVPSEEALKAEHRGDSLHRAYRFEEAFASYTSALENAESPEQASRLEEKMAHSGYALTMTEYCAAPRVVAKQRFSRKDFFLYYPLKAQAWHASPNVLDSLDGFPTYYPKGDTAVFYSARDFSGARSIFTSHSTDSTWTAPRLLGETLTSTGDEVFPMLSPDGKTLYFASDGLYGMGGYDLYTSTWDEENKRWQDPVNMGFPYNSPGDDFLLMDTDDGKYTIFASNRDCSRDSVYIYVLDFEGSRSNTGARSQEDIASLCALEPKAAAPTRIDHSALAGGVKESANMRLYRRKNEEARALRDSIQAHRNDSSLTRLRELVDMLEETNLEIKIIAQAFLLEGATSTDGEEEREVVGATLSYTFAKHTAGGKLRMKIQKNRRSGSFRVMPIGRLAPELPQEEGLYYQIQFLSAMRPVSIEALGGLSPVYRRLPPNLRYTYCVGIFKTYHEALAELNVVRKCGFPEASIVAWRGNRQIPTAQALLEEQEASPTY